MRIALVNNFHSRSGIGKNADNLCIGLQKHGVDAELVSLVSNNQDRSQRVKRAREVRQRFRLPVYNKTFSWYWYFPPRVPDGYDLYHLSSQYLARVAEHRSPCVVSHMDLAPILDVYSRHYPFLLRAALRRALKSYSKMEKVITISQRAKDELLESGLAEGVDEGDIVPIPLGYDESIYYPRDNKMRCASIIGHSHPTKDFPIILYVGTEESRKNVETLLRAMKLLDGDPWLVSVGPTDAQLDGLRRGERIHRVWNVREENMPLIYNAADVFVFPSTYEGGYAFPPVEAMACGVPVVTTRELDMFRGGCYIYDDDGGSPTDPNLLAEAIKEVLRNREYWAGRALAEAKNFTLGKQVEKTMEVYASIA